MSLTKHIKPVRNYWILPVMFLIVFAVLFSFLVYYNHNQQKRLKNEKNQYLQSIGNLKIDKINSWIKERRGEAIFTYHNNGFIELVKQLVEDPGNSMAEIRVEEWLRPMKESHSYRFIGFVTPQGKQLLPADGGQQINSIQKEEAVAAGKRKQIVFSEIIQDNAGGVFIDMLVPLAGDLGELLGIVVFRIDPNTELFPLIKNVTIPSMSLETLLIKREENDVMVLNDLRHKPEIPPMTMIFPIETDSSLKRLETMNSAGIVSAVDYRNVDVLADIRRVDGFDWVLITKMDIDEIFEPLYAQRKQFLLMIVLVSASMALTVFFLIRNRQTRFYWEILQKEIDQKALLKHFEYLKQHANDPMFLMKQGGTFIDVNQRALQNYGYTEGEFLDMKLPDIHPPEKRDEILGQLKKVVEMNGYVYETIHLRKNGEIFPVEVSSRYISLDGQNYFHNIVRDITDRTVADSKILELNQQLTDARDVAEESSKLKSAILMNMSHELRTPLNGILGFTQLLFRKLKGTPEEDMLNHILMSGDRLLKTLTNIMELAQLESEQAPVNTGQHSVKKITNDLKLKFEPLAEIKDLVFMVNIDEDYLIRADGTMIEQSLGHILDNALKFTESGGIYITADQHTVDGKNFTRINIRDTGIGIPGEESENIFTEFRQVSQGYKRQYEGAGIGLSLVKKMIVLMNGTISFDSEPGKGSVFKISLPSGSVGDTIIQKERPSETGTISAVPDDNETPVVLVVEDNNVNARLIDAYLEDSVNVEHAADGETAIKMVRSKHYDIILMDINLGSGIDGLETVERIRNINGYGDTPVVALTGYTMEEDRIRILNRGCDYFLGKPFTQDQLQTLIYKIRRIQPDL